MTTHAYIDVPEQGEYTDRTLATASWWDRYIIHPGTYPLEYVSIGYHPVNPDSRHAYYARARVKATLIQSYRENRLLHHVRADMREKREDTEVQVVIYAYEAEPGSTRKVLDGLGQVRVWVTEHTREAS